MHIYGTFKCAESMHTHRHGALIVCAKYFFCLTSHIGSLNKGIFSLG